MENPAFVSLSYLLSPLHMESANFEIITKISVFQAFPTTQMPEIFGMHDNVDISKELQETRQLFNSVLLAMGSSAGGGAGKTDDMLNEIATDILTKLPPNFDLEKSLEKYPVSYNESMNTVLVQEMERFNK